MQSIKKLRKFGNLLTLNKRFSSNVNKLKDKIVKQKNKKMMSAGEAITETLVSRDVKHVISITGSAFLPASDCFETAGIRLVHVQHEQNAGFAIDGYTRVTPNKTCVTLNQAGPGASNLLTSMATSYWNHSPVVAITPTVDTVNDGKGVFQELNGQDKVFNDQVKYLGNVTRSDRITEILGKGLDRALSNQGPSQVNIPRDFFNAYEEYEIPKKIIPRPCYANLNDINDAKLMIQKAKKPVILAGAGIGWSETGAEMLKKFANMLNIPVATTYLHNDVFPASEPLNVGSLGYFGSRSAMRIVKDSDLVIAVGTRIGPFSVTKQDNIDYWNDERKLIQVDSDRSKLGLSCQPDLAVHSDAGLFLEQLTDVLANEDKRDGIKLANYENNIWYNELAELTQKITIPEDGAIAPRKALNIIGSYIHSLPHPILTTDIGNVCSQMNSYAKFEHPRSYITPGLFGSCGYAKGAAMGCKLASPERDVFAIQGDGSFSMQSLGELLTMIRENIPITVLIARNNMWWAEGLNQHLYYDKRYSGTELDSPSFAKLAESMGNREQIQGIEVREQNDLLTALKKATTNQRNGITTVVEIHVTAEPTAIFRADAMEKPFRFLDKYSHLSTGTNPFN